MRLINEEIDAEENGPKHCNRTSIKRLQARYEEEHDKAGWEEVQRVEKSISWKQSLSFAVRELKNERKNHETIHRVQTERSTA